MDSVGKNLEIFKEYLCNYPKSDKALKTLKYLDTKLTTKQKKAPLNRLFNTINSKNIYKEQLANTVTRFINTIENDLETAYLFEYSAFPDKNTQYDNIVSEETYSNITKVSPKDIQIRLLEEKLAKTEEELNYYKLNYSKYSTIFSHKPTSIDLLSDF